MTEEVKAVHREAHPFVGLNNLNQFVGKTVAFVGKFDRFDDGNLYMKTSDGKHSTNWLLNNTILKLACLKCCAKWSCFPTNKWGWLLDWMLCILAGQSWGVIWILFVGLTVNLWLFRYRGEGDKVQGRSTESQWFPWNQRHCQQGPEFVIWRVHSVR